MKRKRALFTPLVAVLVVFGFITTGFAAKKVVIFGEQNFDSFRCHVAIAAFLMKHGYDFEVRKINAESLVVMHSITNGDIHVNMECWVDNYRQQYQKAMDSGDVIDVGANYPDSWQGWLVPTYVIEGDPERGIKPMAPDLKTVFDMKKYWKLFKDPEDPDKGRFMGCIPGWGCEIINKFKIKGYGLDKYYNVVTPGSDMALNGSMVAAYKKGNPWFGYYWAPTWVLGKLDMTPLEEPPHDPKLWNEENQYACAYPSVRVAILLYKSWAEKYPEAAEVFKNYETNLNMNNKMLAWKRDNKAEPDETAVWFLKTYKDKWTTWVTPEAAKKINAALK